MDLTIEGKAFINGSFEQCCIGINNGKIVTIKKILKSDDHINFNRKLIMPSGIDLHVHFRDPGFLYKEDFSTGSKAALFGGITCVFDMPNTKPQTTSVHALRNKIKNANQKSYVDFGIYAGITEDNYQFIDDLAKHCSGFKIFLGSSTNSLCISAQRLKKIIYELSKINKITLIHAEDQSCLDKNKKVEYNLKDHLKSRPSECEESAIRNVIDSITDYSSKIHICHLSSCEGFELLRKKPKNLSVGITPHHLFFDVDKIQSKQTFYKVNPPIRSHFDRETLWNGVIDGFIDILESDHAPHTVDDKDTDFDSAPSGIPGVETMYPLLLAKAKSDQISYSKVASLICEKPAELLNIPKGKIEVGKDADFIILDLKNTTKIKSEKLHSKCDWSPFEGWPAIFPTDVFLRGNRLIEDNQISSSINIGKYIL